jgi:tetratricopeptide (TPR) repeat protein
MFHHKLNLEQISKSFRIATFAVLGFAFCRALYDCVVVSPPVLVHSKKEERLLWKQFKQTASAHAKPLQLADQLEKLGTLYCENGSYRQADHVFLEALAYSCSASDSTAIRKVLRLLAEENRDAGNYDGAKCYYLRLIAMDEQEHKATDTIFDTNYLGMNAYLAGCSAKSSLKARPFFDEAEVDYKHAMCLVDSISPPPKDMKLLVTNSYEQLLIEEDRLKELAKYCAVSP